jgi:hypothetical protein
LGWSASCGRVDRENGRSERGSQEIFRGHEEEGGHGTSSSGILGLTRAQVAEKSEELDAAGVQAALKLDAAVVSGGRS